MITERMGLGFGVDLVVDELATRLARRGHRVTVYTNVHDGTYSDRPYAIKHLQIPPVRYMLLYDLRAWRHFSNSGVLGRQHDVYLLHTPPYFSLNRALGHRGVVVDYGVVSTRGMSPLRRLNFAWLETSQRLFYWHYARKIITISDWLREDLPRRLRSNARTVYLGSDHYPPSTQESVLEIREQCGIGPGEVMALYVGRLNPTRQPYKGTAELVDMFNSVRKQQPQLRLVMAGTGDREDVNWLRSRMVIPMLSVAPALMPALYSAADLYVTASRWEGFDLPVVEAQRAGTPIVAYAVGAHGEVVDDGVSGKLARTRSEFENAMCELAAHAEVRGRMGASAAEFAKRFTWDKCVDGFEEILSQVVDEDG